MTLQSVATNEETYVTDAFTLHVEWNREDSLNSIITLPQVGVLSYNDALDLAHLLVEVLTDE